MSHRLFSVASAATLAIAGLTGSAHATFFSFASDSNSNNYTFMGTAGSAGSFQVMEASRPNSYKLLIDDDNGPAVTIKLNGVEFRANLTASAAQSVQIAGSIWQHTYRITGTFGFYRDNAPLLVVSVGANNQGVLTVPGTQNAWSATGAIIGADSFADVTYTVTQTLIDEIVAAGANPATYGLAVGPGGTGTSVGPDDFSFDLTVLNTGTPGTTVQLNPSDKTPTTTWKSESSYSGSAFIPAPGAAALMAMGGLVALRRRR